eukprot:gnl/MRDRNA2_/MRDRNA2_20496_c0_seq1.p1 gnl/MRDRNA2_/MRDRNA2_20496_c0~~gnl/MRDRNA2_/MRDRNA2_20496_c0_seq1.p1  ORF type:complete len:974 (-),score=173.57 gnl/MRDRNA2_/MRDRNA2_20496_c0_seq1:63-2984(-)
MKPAKGSKEKMMTEVLREKLAQIRERLPWCVIDLPSWKTIPAFDNDGLAHAKMTAAHFYMKSEDVIFTAILDFYRSKVMDADGILTQKLSESMRELSARGKNAQVLAHSAISTVIAAVQTHPAIELRTPDHSITCQNDKKLAEFLSQLRTDQIVLFLLAVFASIKVSRGLDVALRQLLCTQTFLGKTCLAAVCVPGWFLLHHFRGHMAQHLTVKSREPLSLDVVVKRFGHIIRSSQQLPTLFWPMAAASSIISLHWLQNTGIRSIRVMGSRALLQMIVVLGIPVWRNRQAVRDLAEELLLRGELPHRKDLVNSLYELLCEEEVHKWKMVAASSKEALKYLKSRIGAVLTILDVFSAIISSFAYSQIHKEHSEAMAIFGFPHADFQKLKVAFLSILAHGHKLQFKMVDCIASYVHRFSHKDSQIIAEEPVERPPDISSVAKSCVPVMQAQQDASLTVETMGHHKCEVRTATFEGKKDASISMSEVCAKAKCALLNADSGVLKSHLQRAQEPYTQQDYPNFAGPEQSSWQLELPSDQGKDISSLEAPPTNTDKYTDSLGLYRPTFTGTESDRDATSSLEDSPADVQASAGLESLDKCVKLASASAKAVLEPYSNGHSTELSLQRSLPTQLSDEEVQPLSADDATEQMNVGADESESSSGQESDQGLPLLCTNENGILNATSKPQLPQIDLANVAPTISLSNGAQNAEVAEDPKIVTANGVHNEDASRDPKIVTANGVWTNKGFDVVAPPGQAGSFHPCTSPSTTPVRDQSPRTLSVEGTPIKIQGVKKGSDNLAPESHGRDEIVEKSSHDAPRPPAESVKDEVKSNIEETTQAQASALQEATSPASANATGRVKVASLKIPSLAIEQRVADGCTLFGVEVTPIGDQEQWTVLKRYNDFCDLRDRLGRMPSSVSDVPFPRKHVRSVTGARLEERRALLERWLQRILEVSNNIPAWDSLLQAFFEAERQVLVPRPGA